MDRTQIEVKESHTGRNKSAQVLHTPQNPNTFEIGPQGVSTVRERMCGSFSYLRPQDQEKGFHKGEDYG